jgi:pimeloyl-ACP methyl ester carboxylesterase
MSTTIIGSQFEITNVVSKKNPILLRILGSVLSILIAVGAQAETPGNLSVKDNFRDRPTILFLHGWLAEGDYWQAQSDWFDDNYRVIIPDLPGHGGSQAEFDKLDLAAMAGAVTAYLKQHELEDVVVVGHDIGALVGIEMATTNNLSALIAVESIFDPDLGKYQRRQRQILKRLKNNFPGTVRQITVDLFSANADTELVQLYSDRAASSNPITGRSIIEGLISYPLAEKLSAISLPIVLLNSTRRSIKAWRLKEVIRDLQIHTVPWSGHYGFIEQPDVFNNYLQKLIDRLLNDN